MPTSFRFAFAALIAFGLSACQDPSGVGLELIGEEGNAPSTITIVADTIQIAEAEDQTGGFADNFAPAQGRVLVGAVTDPLFGDVTASAFVDVIPPGTVPEDFLEDAITSASLRFPRDYVWGDSTTTLPIELYGMEEAIEPVNAPIDTLFEVGALIQSYNVPAEDSLFVLGLPQSWIEDNDDLLRGDDAVSGFNGFQVRLADDFIAMPGAVVGFAVENAVLRFTTASDTVDYPLNEVFSRIERGEAAEPPADRIYLRDSSGEALALSFPLDALQNRPIANATIRVNVDEALLDTPGFSRPVPEELALYGRTEDGDRLFILSAAFDEERSAYAFTSSTITNLLQDALLGDAFVTRFELTLPLNPASLNVVPFVTGPEATPGTSDSRPRLSITVIEQPS